MDIDEFMNAIRLHTQIIALSALFQDKTKTAGFQE